MSYHGVLHFVDSWIREPISRRWGNSSPRPKLQETSPGGYSTLVLRDGARLSYEVLGSVHIGRAKPIVLICGMSAIRSDYQRLSERLMKTRPVLLYDHRGIGDSSLTPDGDETITIELLARDLLALLSHLKWREVSICGYSMGGVIAQQFLVLPFHPTKPTHLPIKISHLLLVGTRSVVQSSVGLRIPPPTNQKRTPEERREIARKVVASLVDPSWIEANPNRFDILFQRGVDGNRPSEIIMKQGAALQKFDFKDLLINLSHDLKVMVIHGQLDQVIPYQCGEDIIRCIPWARFVEEGEKPGQVPSLKFGHYWYEYFNAQVWHDVGKPPYWIVSSMKERVQ